MVSIAIIVLTLVEFVSAELDFMVEREINDVICVD
jgi:hypothetical protein